MAEMQNKFWGGASDSDSDDSGSNSDDSEEEQQQQVSHQRQRAVNKYEIESDDDDEVVKGVVKKKKDKHFDALRDVLNLIRNSLKINDWNSILDDFQKLEKVHSKAGQSIKQHGVPGFYISALVILQRQVEDTFKNKPRMSKTNSKAFTRMRHMLKKSKVFTEHSADIEKCKKDPSLFETLDEAADDSASDSDSDSDSSSSSSSDSDSSSDEGDDEQEDEQEISDSDSEEWDSDSSDSDSDDDDVLDKRFTREFWVKKDVDEIDEEDEKEKRLAKEKARELRKQKEKEEREERERQAKAKADAQDTEVLTPEMFDTRLRDILSQRGKKSTNSREQIASLQKLAMKAHAFGPERLIPIQMHLITAQLDQLRSIDAVLSNDAWQSCVDSLLRVVRSLQENPTYTLKLQEGTDMSAQSIMATSARQKKKLRAGKEDVSANTNPAESAESKDPQKRVHIPVVGDLGQYLLRLSREFDKSLQKADPHSEQYIILLRNEATLLLLAKEVQEYYETEVSVDPSSTRSQQIEDGILPQTAQLNPAEQDPDAQTGLIRKPRNIDMAALSALIRIEHIYYKHKSIAQTLRVTAVQESLLGRREYLHPAALGKVEGYTIKKEKTAENFHPAALSGTPKQWMKHNEKAKEILSKTNMDKLMDRLCKLIYAVGDSQSKVRAMLCHIFYHALHDRFYEARDLLLMSHLQDSIMHTDISTQVLFNRAMAQVGLCAFRHGLLKIAHDCLSEICFGNRAKELLAQGMQWRNRHQQDRFSEEEERAERRRLLPFHLHINLDLLECCHLVSASLLEIPTMAIEEIRGYDASQDRWRVISKAFRRLRENNARLVFKGPPETPRDTVMAAAQSLASGDWRTAAKQVMDLGVWDLIPAELDDDDIVRTCEDEKLMSILELQSEMTWGGNVLVKNLSKVRQMLLLKFREVALRTYLLTFSMHYNSMSLNEFTRMFELPKGHIHALISKMMIAEEIHASWDQTSDTIVMLKSEPSKLQSLALQFGDRAAHFVEANERMLDAETNLYRFEYDDEQGQGYKGKNAKADYRQGRFASRRGPKFKGRIRGKGERGGRRGRGRRSGYSNSWRDRRKENYSY